jgi:pimeloyl-ACP methyl ester carboxylesterase
VPALVGEQCRDAPTDEEHIMSQDRIHRAVSDDGTEIAGRVVGQGPPLVLVHGALYDGETAWSEMLPHLTDRFTCFLPSTRGRGLSAPSDDYALQRSLEDVTAFVDSIGEPVALAGWSGGGMHVLGATARSKAVVAVAAYEPAVFDVISEEDFARFSATAARMVEQAERGRLFEAARIFTELVSTDEERRAVIASGRLELAARNIPVELQGFARIGESSGPTPTDPEVLAAIDVPVLLVQGERTPWSWFAEGIRHVAAHVGDVEVRTIPGAGHGAPGIMPEPLASELVRFFTLQHQPA